MDINISQNIYAKKSEIKNRIPTNNPVIINNFQFHSLNILTKVVYIGMNTISIKNNLAFYKEYPL